MRVGMVLDWWMHATSLVNLSKNMFRELGILMNKHQDFTIAGIRFNQIKIGDINQHYDIIHIPNMGGYRFPDLSILNCKNIILSPSGIDEVVLGREVFKSDADWQKYKPIIKSEVQKWKKYHKYIKYIHVVTNSEKNDMMKHFDITEEKFVIIPHGVDHSIFSPPLNKEQTRKNILAKFFLKNNPYFIHVSEGNWARKNIFNIFSAFEKAKKNGLIQNLIIIGKNDPIVNEKAKKIPGIFVLGFVNQNHLVEFLQGADAIMLPSKHEGFGLPLLEAMACGTPSITSTTFSPPEVVGDSGILVDPYDVTAISEQILKLGNDEKLRNRLSQKALILSKNYSWSKTAEELYKLYKKILPETNSDFKHDYNISALRTLTTIFETDTNRYNIAVSDLLKLDFARMINWVLQVGLEKESVRDFALPFEKWYKN